MSAYDFLLRMSLIESESLQDVDMYVKSRVETRLRVYQRPPRLPGRYTPQGRSDPHVHRPSNSE